MTTAVRPRGRPPSGGREQILEATHALLSERGMARLTTREVARRAGVSEGSVFYHFEDRAGLLKAVFERSLGPLHLEQPEPLEPPEPPAPSGADLRAVVSAMSTSIEEFLTQSLDVLFAAQSDAELRDSLHAYMLDNDFGPHRGIASIGAYVESLQAAGVVRRDVEARVVASMIVNDAFQRAAVPKLVGHRKGIQDRKAFVDTLVAMLTPITPVTQPAG